MGEKIKFVSIIEGLTSIKECLPRPTKQFIPQWFKDIPSDAESTVKKCPSFPDYFSMGYVVPMWMDSKIYYDSETEQWGAESTDRMPNWEIHNNRQLVDFKKPSFMDKEANFVFKAVCPWLIVTPPGWSVLQLPLFYHFNKKWSVLPGVIDTDIHHEINQQVLYHADKEPVTILRGEPFAMYIPFERKRMKLDLEILERDEKIMKKFRADSLDLFTKFKDSGVYRRRQRERDNGRS